MHINKHLATKLKPNLFPHGRGTGAPKAVRIKLRPMKHALAEKLRVRKIHDRKRAYRLRRKQTSPSPR